MTTVRLARITGILGLVAVLLLFGPTITISTLGEPGFMTTAAAARTFFGEAAAPWAQLVMAFTALAGIAILWFVAAFSTLLHRREAGVPWLSITALGSGIIVAGYAVLDASWEAAAFGGTDVEPAVAKYAFDAGNLAFANTWLAVASLAISAGWVVITSQVFARWIGWWAVICGIGLVASRFFWTSEIWLLPYSLFWIWVITISVQLVVRPSRVESADGSAARPDASMDRGNLPGRSAGGTR